MKNDKTWIRCVRWTLALAGCFLLAQESAQADDNHAKGSKCKAGSPPQSAYCVCTEGTGDPHIDTCYTVAFVPAVDATCEDVDDKYSKCKLKNVSGHYSTTALCCYCYIGTHLHAYPNLNDENISWIECG